MQTKRNLGDFVTVVCKIVGIKISDEGIKYNAKLPNGTSAVVTNYGNGELLIDESFIEDVPVHE